MMANNLTLLGRHPEAVAAAEKAVLVSPNHADTLILAAWALAPNGRAKEAAQFAQHAFRLNPYPPEWYDGALADSLLFSNRVDEALKHHQRCVEKLPDFLFCRLGLVASFGLSGRMKEATVHATEALRINPKITASDNTFVKVIGHPDERARVENSFRLAGLK